ncbi:MAG: YdcH family protein [Reyranellaceae bacterium]
MSNTPHTLGEEFPGQMKQINALKIADPAFAGLLREYDEVNDKIHLAEMKVAPVSQDHETALRKQRLAIKDKIAEALRGA